MCAKAMQAPERSSTSSDAIAVRMDEESMAVASVVAVVAVGEEGEEDEGALRFIVVARARARTASDGSTMAIIAPR